MKASSGLGQWKSGFRYELLGSSVSRNRLFVSPVVIHHRSPRLPAIKAAYNSDGGSKRSRVYKESQAASGFPNAKVQQIASSVLPLGSFAVVTFGTSIARRASFVYPSLLKTWTSITVFSSFMWK